MASAPFNRHGGLTLVPTPGFEKLAEEVKGKVEAIGVREKHNETPVDIVMPTFGTRASGEIFLQLGKEHIGGHDCVVFTSGPGTPFMLNRLEMLLAYLAGRRAGRITIVCGYLPLGRSDKDEGTLELAMAPLPIYLMKRASEDKLDRIISVDLHAPQVVMSGGPGIITEVSLVRRLLTHAVNDAISEGNGTKICLVFPDDGAVKRVESAIEQLKDRFKREFPLVCGTKRRQSSKDSRVGRLYGDLEALRDAIALTVDDEIATGGTNVNVAIVLKTQYEAVRVWGVVTHGVLCGDAPQRFLQPECPVDRIYVTDTIPVEGRAELQPLLAAGRLKVVSWADDLGWICYQHHWDQSLREMR